MDGNTEEWDYAVALRASQQLGGKFNEPATVFSVVLGAIKYQRLLATGVIPTPSTTTPADAV